MEYNFSADIHKHSQKS